MNWTLMCSGPVSYTHLDVYKRQFQGRAIHHDVAIAVSLVCNNALESVGIFFPVCVSSYIIVRVIGCDKDIVRTPSVQIQCTCNIRKLDVYKRQL